MANSAPTIGSYDENGQWSGMHSGDPDRHVAEWVRQVKERGHATTESGYRPAHHHTIGVGQGHQDDQFADAGTSHTAWVENEAYGPFLNPGNEARKLMAARVKAAKSGTEFDRNALLYQQFRLALARAKAGS